jgi:hypothetical protein
MRCETVTPSVVAEPRCLSCGKTAAEMPDHVIRRTLKSGEVREYRYRSYECRVGERVCRQCRRRKLMFRYVGVGGRVAL